MLQGGVECTFEWNVVGGTDEEWLLQILADKATRTYTCEIERYVYARTLSHLSMLAWDCINARVL